MSRSISSPELTVETLFAGRGNIATILKKNLEEPVLPRVIAMTTSQLQKIRGIGPASYTRLVSALKANGMYPTEDSTAIARLSRFYGDVLEMPAIVMAQVDPVDPSLPVTYSDISMKILQGIADIHELELSELRLKDVVTFSYKDLCKMFEERSASEPEYYYLLVNVYRMDEPLAAWQLSFAGDAELLKSA